MQLIIGDPIETLALAGIPRKTAVGPLLGIIDKGLASAARV
jgi:hypothetical protein